MTTELAEKFFECADEHSVFVQGGNKPGATLEGLRWRKRYLPGLSLAAFLLIGVPAIVLLFWGASWMDKLPQPVPWWQGLLWLVVLFTLFWREIAKSDC